MIGYDEDGSSDVRVAPPRAKGTSSNATAAPGGIKALSAKEWAQVEDVSHSVRAVGQVMSTEADRIAQGLPPPELPPLQFSLERFKALRAATAPDGKKEDKEKGKKSKKSESLRKDIFRQQDNKLIAQDREKIAACGASTTAPRLEAFSTRTEAFVAALIAWASNKHTCPLDAVISLYRARDMIIRRCGGAANREVQEVAEELKTIADSIGTRKRGLRGLLDLAVQKEEILSSPSFVQPGNIALYPEQREVAGIIADAVRPNSKLVCLVRYVTPPSGGKSSAAALFGAVVQQARGEAVSRGNLGPVLIYACFSNAVRVEVSKTLIAASVPFGMLTSGVVSLSYRCYDGCKTKKKWKPQSCDTNQTTIADRLRTSLAKSTECSRPPSVFVCDLESALGLVMLPERKDVDPLVVDEPTAGVEGGGAVGSGGFARIQNDVSLCASLLSAAPRCTILMSATVPDFDEMPLLVALAHGRFKRLSSSHPVNEDNDVIGAKWKGIVCKLVEDKSPLGLLEWSGDAAPEECLRTISSKRLPVGLRALDASGRQWCPHHLCVGKQSFQTLLEVLPTDGHLLRFYCIAALAKLVDELDADPATLGLGVQDIVTHDAVRAACLRLLQNNSEKLIRTEEVQACTEKLTVPCVARSEAHRFPGATLVVADEVEAFYEDAMIPLLTEAKADPLRRVLRKMAAAVAQQEADDKKKRKHHRKQRGGVDSSSSDEDAGDHHDEVAPPKVPWPSLAVVNSLEHLGRYGPRNLEKRPSKSAPDVPHDVVESSAEALVESILSGVALLNTRWTDQAFELSAIGLADKGLPSLVVADTSMVYGTNLPVDRAMVLTERGKLSSPELRQFCGRAGRTGKAGRAEVVFGSSWEDLADALSVHVSSTAENQRRCRSQLDRAVASVLWG